MSTIKPGQIGFWLDDSGLPAGGVVTRAKEYKRFWQLVRLQPGKWQLRHWQKEKDKAPIPAMGEAVNFKAKTKAQAEHLARGYIKLCRDTWYGASPQENVFTNVPAGEQERWIDAWIRANKSGWPNLFNVPKGKPADDAIAADLIAMGFTVEATRQISQLVVKTKITEADRLDIWLVKNWFHGEKLADKIPAERLALVLKSGCILRATVRMVGMRLTRLALTHRTKAE